jgi:hypothetical protein
MRMGPDALGSLSENDSRKLRDNLFVAATFNCENCHRLVFTHKWWNRLICWLQLKTRRPESE